MSTGQKNKTNKFRMFAIVSLFMLLIVIPTPVLAAESDKWYMKPFEWMIGMAFKYILEPFLGIHEPAYYIFYQGDGLIWGLYTQEQFDKAIQNGFNMMLFIVSVMLVTAIIKMGAQNAYSKFSASMKVDLMDNGLKVIIALILLFQFFPIINTFFQFNVYGIQLFEAGIKDPTSLTELGADILTSADGTKKPGDEITFTDLDNGENHIIKNLIISFFSLGVALWFKAYYIQRIFMISGLIILAPIWISTMFFPKLQGITNTAFKELWAQIMAQTIHAATFFLYFHLFDGSEDWFTYVIGLAIFIPVSESIRFAMGATSENGGRLATIGTLAGAGTLMHMGKAAGDIRNGFKNSFMERKGAFDGQGNTGGGSQQNSFIPGFAKESGDRQYGGTANMNASPNKFARNMRSFGHVAAGVGSAMMRTGGFSAGMAVNPITGHLAAEAGAKGGQIAGYASGVMSYAGGKGIQGKVKNASEGFRESFQSSQEQGHGAFRSTMSGLGNGMKEGTVSTEYRQNPIRRNELNQKIGGAIGEASFGRGVGYQMGSSAAQMLGSKGMDNVDISQLDAKKDYAIVTSNRGSYLAQKGPNNKMTPMTNMKAGDPSLPNGQMVIQDYKVRPNEQGMKSFQATSSQYAIKNVPSRDGGTWKKESVEMPAKQPNIQEFLNKQPILPPKEAKLPPTIPIKPKKV
jgi:hypothetical protein